MTRYQGKHEVDARKGDLCIAEFAEGLAPCKVVDAVEGRALRVECLSTGTGYTWSNLLSQSNDNPLPWSKLHMLPRGMFSRRKDVETAWREIGPGASMHAYKNSAIAYMKAERS